MNLPSRGERESATTMRYTGFFFDPTRVNLIRTANELPPCLRSLLPLVRLRRLAASLLLRRRGLSRERAQIRQLPLAHSLHELFHLPACLDQPVDRLDGRARSVRDSLAARPVDHAWQRALLRRHREDDRFDARELLLVDLIETLELLADAGDQLQEALDRSHPAHHPVGLQEVVEAEPALEHAGLELLLLVLLHGLLRALDQRQHVAHAEDARGHPVRMEVLQLIELLPDGDELDRSARDGLHRERRAAARVAVELRHQDAVERDALLERERHVHRLLSRHGVEHEQDIRRLRLVTNALELVHQLLVDMQAAGGVQDDRVYAVLGESADAVVDDRHRIRIVLAVNGNLNLPAELLELVDRGGSLKVGGDEPRLPSLLAQEQRKLGRSRCLPGPLQTREQDYGRRATRERKLRAACTHQRRELLVDGLHHLLARRQALQHLLAERALAHLRHELLHDLEVDVGLEQREPDLAHRAGDGLLVELAAPAEIAERALEPV